MRERREDEREGGGESNAGRHDEREKRVQRWDKRGERGRAMEERGRERGKERLEGRERGQGTRRRKSGETGRERVIEDVRKVRGQEKAERDDEKG